MLKDIRKYWFIRLILYPLSVLYGIISDLRNLGYSAGIFTRWKCDVPVISIGNMIAGGTGKTPFTMLCIDLLKEQYQQIVVVSRGYQRKSKGLQIVSDGQGTVIPAEMGGDEPVMIATKYPQVPVIVSENRKEGIKQAVNGYRADLILLDDAFQHRKVARSCDLLLINGGRDLNRERLLPLGDLRERLKHLRRADIVLLNTSQGTLSKEDRGLLNFLYKGPVFDCHFRPKTLVNSRLEKIADINILRGKSAYLLCAIAAPDQFVETIAQLGAEIQKIHIFPDHHFFTTEDYEQIKDQYQALKCDYLLCTEKDMVKLETSFLKGLNLVAVGLQGEVINSKSFVDKLIQFIDNTV